MQGRVGLTAVCVCVCVLGIRFSPTVTLSSMLQLIATERSKYAAASAREHFAANPAFLRVVLTRGPRIPAPSWLPLILEDGGGTPGALLAPGALPDDLFVDGVTGEPSPLVDFNRRETTFVGRFLHVVCHATGLIQPQSAASLKPRSVRPRSARPHAAEMSEAATNSAEDEVLAVCSINH